ncbi:MAG: inositol monophosphatase [Candidatus Muproteobacteria bacterium RIFCSPHIGHO2_01_FULL_65_16]|uniref:Inositol-1-monophosphatase n=3 Tax=Candidatus Muproteobacteria TaxID=1817795 RepID=A0A1F6TGX7_9PROT|nr:MAG: inositol monophosphatase [Candidatus Muproteobacteria bacterium RBG_16_65_31]OGI46370.1 MAG: inositol monophosphatase [Candidatus Muproteobacteria bacterium RIFCSPHIGHO2_01_FULL_65_16]OGI52745.1 MAG: inositol monophosphatase [Candidatus Muproteobacteria bacterium RIFCSPHIGHO2_02_FULL_65_16]
MHPMLNTAIKAARRAGGVIMRHLDRLERLTVETKGRNDFVSEVDRQAEAEIIHILRTAYPDHAILAEETGAQPGDHYQWVIDPLDGTTNFLHGYPQFGVSIALRHKGRLEQAVVFDPHKNELFTAGRGQGAHLNDRRIRVSKITELELALLGTGFPFRSNEYLEIWINTLRELLTRTSGIRRAGSASLDLAHVACGRFDGFWEFGLSPWDMAAGCLLIQEAGGMVSDFAGGQNYLESGNIVAGAPKIFDAMLRHIQLHLPPEWKR